jgi:protein-S-isoprenylcysteine O-methyltransferase Ste14
MRPIEARIGSALFFLLAPGTIAGLIPWWITGWRTEPGASHAWSIFGAILIIPFAMLLIACFVQFAQAGGTPAPVAPTQRLVATGLYRYVRNPMYIAVSGLIFAQMWLFGSAALLAYGVVIATAFVLFVLAYEEPALRRAYGDEYARYCRNVPAWLPRPSPWRGDEK